MKTFKVAAKKIMLQSSDPLLKGVIQVVNLSDILFLLVDIKYGTL